MDTLTVGDRELTVDSAGPDDLTSLLALLRDDSLGAAREPTNATPTAAQQNAFAAISEDPAHQLVVIRDHDGTLLATAQLTLVPGLARGGATRLLVEAVRVASSERGSGLGTALFDWIHAEGRRRGASLVQLTSDRSRTDAHRFYERLGYAASHVGFKLPL